MSSHTLTTLPDRQMLRALYEAAITEINTTRSNVDLTTGFYAETGNAVFDAGYLALSDYCKGSAGPRRLHVISAPAGGGKTSYSYALMLALTRYADLRSQGVTSVRAIATQLNERGILTPRGGEWHPTSAARLLSRHENANCRVDDPTVAHGHPLNGRRINGTLDKCVCVRSKSRPANAAPNAIV
jgi:hypothetical protein